MLRDFDEARKKGEGMYNGNPFRIVMIPNGEPGNYDVVYETLPYHTNTSRSSVTEEKRINLLGVLEIGLEIEEK